MATLKTDITLNWIPVGKYKNTPVKNMHLNYLLWWCTRDSLRRKHPTTTLAIAAELRKRFADVGIIEHELLYEDLI